MIKKPLNIIFKNVDEISKKLNININDRPQNLPSLKYFEICREYENYRFLIFLYDLKYYFYHNCNLSYLFFH